jgi:VWFA-related protein
MIARLRCYLPFLFVFLLFQVASGQSYFAPVSSVTAAKTTDVGGIIGIIIPKRVDEVNLTFTVTDKKGHFIKDLAPEDLQVFDNQRPPEKLTAFEEQTNLPLRVVLLIDASDSIKYRLNYEKQAAVVFLRKILRPGTDKAFIATFNDQITPLSDFTDDVRVLTRQVKATKAGGNTVLYDAIVYASNRLAARSEGEVTRKIIIVISDGDDTASARSLLEALTAALRSEVALFALSTNDLLYDRHPPGEKALALLSEPTGGRIVPAHADWQLQDAFKSIGNTLRNQYAIAYTPPDFKPDGSYRRVELILHRPKLKAAFRKGYYARRERAELLSWTDSTP